MGAPCLHHNGHICSPKHEFSKVENTILSKECNLRNCLGYFASFFFVLYRGLVLFFSHRTMKFYWTIADWLVVRSFSWKTWNCGSIQKASVGPIPSKPVSSRTNVFLTILRGTGATEPNRLTTPLPSLARRLLTYTHPPPPKFWWNGSHFSGFSLWTGRQSICLRYRLSRNALCSAGICYVTWKIIIEHSAPIRRFKIIHFVPLGHK